MNHAVFVLIAMKFGTAIFIKLGKIYSSSVQLYVFNYELALMCCFQYFFVKCIHATQDISIFQEN